MLRERSGTALRCCCALTGRRARPQQPAAAGSTVPQPGGHRPAPRPTSAQCRPPTIGFLSGSLLTSSASQRRDFQLPDVVLTIDSSRPVCIGLGSSKKKKGSSQAYPISWHSREQPRHKLQVGGYRSPWPRRWMVCACRSYATQLRRAVDDGHYGSGSRVVGAALRCVFHARGWTRINGRHAFAGALQCRASSRRTDGRI